MTPQEKAQELLDNMNVVHYLKLKGKNKDSKGLPVHMHKSQIKQCALKAVDEIINEYESNICNTGYDYDFERWDMQRDYWIQVKYEIDNIKN